MHCFAPRTLLHCAASCNNLKLVQLLVENGAAVFARTTSDGELAADKCEVDENGIESVHKYLLG